MNRNKTVYNQLARAAWIGLGLNLLLGVVKLIGGIVGNSFALIADSVNSLGDVVSTVIVLVALWVSQHPADVEHPYGHSRAEGIAANNVAVLILASALMVLWEAVSRFFAPHPIPPTWTLWIAACNIVIKESLYWYNRSVGLRTQSASLLANAWDHRSDALCSLAVLIGLSLIRLGGEKYIWADEAASIIVASAIAFSGIRLFMSSASELMDYQADPDMVRQFTQTALEIEGVKGVEKLLIRKSGIEYFADMHIEVDANESIEYGHRIGHRVKAKLMQEHLSLRDVLVHLEPYPHIHDSREPESLL